MANLTLSLDFMNQAVNVGANAALAKGQRMTMATEMPGGLTRNFNLRAGNRDLGVFARKGSVQVEENNRARQHLVDALLLQFGKATVMELPRGVRAALKVGGLRDDLKLDAQGKVTSGRPLTARRVRAVLAAVKTELAAQEAALRAAIAADATQAVGKGRLTLPFSAKHLAEMKRQLEDYANRNAHTEILGEDGHLGQIARDMNGGYQMVYGGVKSHHPGAVNDLAAQRAILADLRPVFTGDDGTCHEEALNAFVHFGHQGLNAIVCMPHLEAPGDGYEFPAFVNEDSTAETFRECTKIQVRKGAQANTWQVAFNFRREGSAAWMIMDTAADTQALTDKADRRNFIEWNCAFTYTVENGEMKVLSFDRAEVEMDLKPEVVA